MESLTEARPPIKIYRDGFNVYFSRDGLIKAKVRVKLCFDCPKRDYGCVTLLDEDECEEFQQAVEKAFEEGER